MYNDVRIVQLSSVLCTVQRIQFFSREQSWDISVSTLLTRKLIVRSQVALPHSHSKKISISTWFTSRLIIRLIAVEAVLMRQEGHLADTFSGLDIIAVSVILAGPLLHTIGRLEGSVSMNMVHRQFNRVCIFCFWFCCVFVKSINYKLVINPLHYFSIDKGEL